MSNGSNFPDLSDKILVCFVVPTAPLKHSCYTMRLVTHSTYFQDKLSPILSTPPDKPPVLAVGS